MNDRFKRAYGTSLRSIGLMLASIGVLSACSDSDPSVTAGWDGQVIHEPGLTSVHNSANPLTTSLSIDTAWTLSASPDPTDSTDWGDPTVLVAGDSLLYLLDPPQKVVHAISASGQLRFSIGRAGPGPGELMQPSFLGVTADRIVVGDGGKASLEWFTRSGKYVRSQPIGAVALQMLPVGRDSVLLYSLLGNDAEWRLHTAHRPATVFAMPDAAARRPDEARGRASSCQRRAVTPLAVLQLDCTVPVLTVNRLGSEHRTVITLQSDTVFASPTELDAFAANIREMMRAANMSPAQIAATVDQAVIGQRVKRRMQGVRWDPAGDMLLLWEQNPSDLGGGPAIAHFLTIEGLYIGSVTFQETWRDVTMQRGQIVALTADPESGLASLRAYTITLPDLVLQQAREDYARAFATGTGH